ncbi:glycosyltransferase [Paenibacillus lautus]|uniref:glycosyltransferase n=1 Tax=Paenibacillus lautus TaxID=1401 RepID=UPI003D2C3715
MRILFICPQISGWGGMESVTSRVIKALQKKKHEVNLILVERSFHPEWEEDLPVCHLLQKSMEKKSINIGSSIFELIENIGVPDIVITMNAKLTAITRRALNNLPKRPPIVSWIHLSLKETSGAMCVQMADAHIAIGEGIKQELLTLDKYHPVHVLNNPIILPNKAIKRSEIPVLVFIGRLTYNPKRLDKLINALGSFKHKQWKLIVIGDGADKQNLEDLAKSKGINQKIKWMGWIDNPWAQISEATIAVLTSDYEAFPLVIIEALSHGLPVISSDCPTGPKEIINHGRNGWLFKTDDLEDLRYYLHKIIYKEVNLPSDEECRESVMHLNIDIVIEKLEDILSNVSI